ncbi:MAG TPA: prephenate dehydrogenase/arogenate dehydrogenase family protein [Thermoplasmata archaeon]|nr:prephenate dehydrogenase/arogenate dehydrogenase family protein [Thermoplasmata archaeon]
MRRKPARGRKPAGAKRRRTSRSKSGGGSRSAGSRVRLKAARIAIASVDRELVRLVRRRLNLARQVGDVKRRAGIPIRDFAVEKEVLERVSRECVRLGVEPEVGQRMARLLIRASVQTQEELFLPERGEAQILVVGGAGRMGRWLCDFLVSRGHRVEVCDPAKTRFPEAPLERAADADFVILATPISKTPELLRRIIDLKPRGVVFDICSLKSPIELAIQRARATGVRVCSIHPMFGPSAVLLSGRVVAICDCGDKEAVKLARSLFEGTALRITEFPVAQHDRLMAYVLGLSHLVNLVTARALTLSGTEFKELSGVASTTFRKMIATAAEVVNENPALYYEIQNLNPHSGEVASLLGTAVREMEEASISERANPEEFERLMLAAREYFGDASTGAGELE